jgi:hypothetical protein
MPSDHIVYSQIILPTSLCRSALERPGWESFAMVVLILQCFHGEVYSIGVSLRKRRNGLNFSKEMRAAAAFPQARNPQTARQIVPN